MNILFCGSFLNKIIAYYVHTRHKWHSYEIWSKTKHFEILTIQTRGSGFQLSHQDQELILEKNYHGLLKIEKFIYNPLNVMNKTHKLFRKQRRLNFQPNLPKKWNFTKIEVENYLQKLGSVSWLVCQGDASLRFLTG